MQIELLQHQFDFVSSTTKNNALIGGIGSGKSFAGCARIVSKIGLYPKALGFIGAPVHRQLQTVTLKDFFEFLDECKMLWDYNEQKGRIKVDNGNGTTTIMTASMTNHKAIRGAEYGWATVDEAVYTEHASLRVLMGRMRDKNGDMGIDCISSPNGFDFIYNTFHPNGEFWDHNFRLIKAKTQENIHLPETYITSLISQYGGLNSKLAQQEILGEFVNIKTGRIYWAFDREKHVKPCKRDPDYPIYISMDFNVDPMTASIFQIINDRMYVFAEIHNRDSNTIRTGQELKNKYGTQFVTIIPDSTGLKNTTNSSQSDLKILRDLGFTVSATTNPYRMDRYNALNLSFDKNLIILDPSCKFLINDLEQVSYKEGDPTGKPETTNKLLTHSSDNLGYGNYKTINPLRRNRRGIRIS